ncbi:leukocyte surface antigen CD47 isoform X2 [Pelodiscus sinensis]|uniref:leukocyte surface antigen CD47 isoform X2 n=1 Tax=Pelodiscus sinensis TaxID=13735 RepID=UPI003F6BA432
MWALGAWMLLGALGTGSSQLMFNATKSVESSICNTTVMLPCIVNNLELKKTERMFIKWKLGQELVFAYEGVKRYSHRTKDFPSAMLAFEDRLPQGIASLKLSRTEAPAGNYTCEVTESNREGETIIELTYRQENTCKSDPQNNKNTSSLDPQNNKNTSSLDPQNNKSWFTSLENILIIFFLVLAILSYWIHLGITVSKFETAFWKKRLLFIGGVVITVLALIGFILLVPGGFGPKNQAGLSLIVLPSVILVPLQYFLLQIVSGSKLSRFDIFLLVVESLGYVIALIGFALCVTACPPKNGSVVIIGLVIIAFVEVAGLILGIVGYTKKDHQPSMKSVEEPLNG